MADQRRLYLLISDTLGSEGKAVESQKVSFHRVFVFLSIARCDVKLPEISLRWTFTPLLLIKHRQNMDRH